MIDLSKDDPPSSLLPMLIWGLVLIVVGMIGAVVLV